MDWLSRFDDYSVKKVFQMCLADCVTKPMIQESAIPATYITEFLHSSKSVFSSTHCRRNHPNIGVTYFLTCLCVTSKSVFF